MDRVGVGIVGLGNISGAYLKAAKEFFPILDIRAVADLNPDAAKAKADEFGLKAMPLDDIFKVPEVEIILNLTIPRAHVDVGLRAIDAGKHVYSEKPLGVEFAQGKKLVAAGKAKGLRVGSAPDTFLGGAHQTSRRLVDEGVIGTPVGNFPRNAYEGAGIIAPIEPDKFKEFSEAVGRMQRTEPNYSPRDLDDIRVPEALTAWLVTVARREAVRVRQSRRRGPTGIPDRGRRPPGAAALSASVAAGWSCTPGPVPPPGTFCAASGLAQSRTSGNAEKRSDRIIYTPLP